MPRTYPSASRRAPVCRLFPRSGRWLAAAVALLSAAPAGAQPAGAPAEGVLAARLEWHRQLARQAAAELEKAAVAPPGARPDSGTMGRLGNPQAVLNLLRGKDGLTEQQATLRQKLDALVATAPAREKQAVTKWSAVYQNRVAFQQHVDQEQARHGFEFATNSPPPLRLGPPDAAVLAWAVVAIAVGWVMAVHEFRVGIRRRRRGRVAAAGLAVLVLLPASGGGCAGATADTRSWADREELQLNREAAEAAKQADAAEAEANKNWPLVLKDWSRLLAADADDARSLEQAFLTNEAAIRQSARRLAEASILAERLTQEAEAERTSLDADRARLKTLVETSQYHRTVYNVGRVVVGAVLVGLVFAPLYWARRRRRRWRARQAEVCPRCLAEGRMRQETVKLRYGKSRTVVCEECGFRIDRDDARLPRLCFPTVGVRTTGKTHMLFTAYDRIRSGTAPTAAALECVPSDADEQFEKRVELILGRGEARGTAHDRTTDDVTKLPSPIILRVEDADTTGETSVLVNLFDYGGEMVRGNVKLEEDLLRQRAVRHDGFMFFLDPTQLYGDVVDGRHNLRLDDQLKALIAFHKDMRTVRKIGGGAADGSEGGAVISLPVAVCISKFDLLKTENPIRGLSVPYIHKLVTDLNPPGPLSLRTIAARSAAVEEMLPLMFPGLDLRKKLGQYFGGRVMFFPTSAVSLNLRELGVRDLKQRTIAPFGVVEPILWLLHMHGYQVFDE